MSYTTPVMDRSITDIINKTAKAYMNAVDWNRIYSNSIEAHAVILTYLEIDVPFTTVATVTRTLNPQSIVGTLNTILSNVEAMRQTVNPTYLDLPTAIKTDWSNAVGAQRPNYINANLWEYTIDVIFNDLPGVINRIRFARTGIAVAGADLIRNNMFRSYE